MLNKLDKELQLIDKDDAHKVCSVMGFANVVTYESLRDDPDPNLISLSLQGLQHAIEAFERSHPKLYELIQAICIRLTGMGV